MVGQAQSYNEGLIYAYGSQVALTGTVKKDWGKLLNLKIKMRVAR